MLLNDVMIPKYISHSDLYYCNMYHIKKNSPLLPLKILNSDNKTTIQKGGAMTLETD